jgi:hypothetical protein
MEARPTRSAPIELDAEEFRRLGHGVVDAVADFLRTQPERPVAPSESPDEVRDALGRLTHQLEGEIAAHREPDEMEARRGV